MRDLIFISHANPEENDQARWLGIQLMSLGYLVWCDIFNLKGGEKFWKEIEEAIRQRAIKFLYILTNISNQRDGCLNELAVAEKTNKVIDDNKFIITLHFDSNLSYDDININLNRKISIDFKKDWRKGLNDLLEIFIEQNIPKQENPDYNYINNYWNSIYLNNRTVIERRETYSSNWFPFLKLPEKLFIHSFKGMIPKGFNWESLQYPTLPYKRHTITFSNIDDFIEVFPKTKEYNPKESVEFKVNAILNEGFENSFIKNRTLKNCINNLISKAFINAMLTRDLLSYQMSNKMAFCFTQDLNHSKDFSHGQLVGKLKEKTWHFAFSGFPDLNNNVFVFKSHILFTEDGKNFISSKRSQQSSRRRQGKNWWNKHWKDKLMSTIILLSNENEHIKIPISSDENVILATEPICFYSSVSYIDPDESKEALDDFDNEGDTIE